MRQSTNVMWGYVAGFFDGEGSIGADKYHMCVMSQATYQGRVIEVVADFLESQGIGCTVCLRQKNGHTPMNVLWVTGGGVANTLKFLKKIEPLLVVKREKARTAIKEIEATWKIRDGRAIPNVTRGIACNLAKLTEEEVRAIRRLRGKGVSGPELARRFGVGKTAIYAICSRETWAHV